MEFVEVMKQWNLMCQYFSEKENACTRCPLKNEICVGAWQDKADNMDWSEVERRVRTWMVMKDPVYPTWLDWLTMIGVVSPTVAQDKFFDMNGRFKEHISSDIAESLGLLPMLTS